MSTLDRDATAVVAAPAKGAAVRTHPGLRSVVRVAVTLAAAAIAVALGFFAWRAYMGTPWTRDGTVRAYVVSIAPQVAGQIVELPVGDNAFVHKGDLLMQIDPASYALAVRQAQASVQQAKALAQNADAEWARRQKLNDLAVTLEEQQTYASKSLSALAQYQHALADLDTARLNLKRTRIVSPVNGYVTNLETQVGDYANVGQARLALINADSFWVDAYFEETFLSQIRDGDAAKVKLMGYPEVLRGRVQSLARGISVANAAQSASGLAEVNPVFTFVRLAQRVPVRIHLEAVPADLRLVAGMTATVTIVPGARAAAAAGPADATPRVAATGANGPAAVAPAGAASAATPPSSGGPALPELADAGAAAILPPLPVALRAGRGAAGGASGPAATAPALQNSGPAKAPTPAPAGRRRRRPRAPPGGANRRGHGPGHPDPFRRSLRPHARPRAAHRVPAAKARARDAPPSRPTLLRATMKRAGKTKGRGLLFVEDLSAGRVDNLKSRSAGRVDERAVVDDLLRSKILAVIHVVTDQTPRASHDERLSGKTVSPGFRHLRIHSIIAYCSSIAISSVRIELKGKVPTYPKADDCRRLVVLDNNKCGRSHVAADVVAELKS